MGNTAAELQTVSLASQTRVRVAIQGTVQGVGFRPFVYRLATEMGLRGWVINNLQGVTIEAEGPRAELDHFLTRLAQEKPALAALHSFEASFLDPVGFEAFEIRHSDADSGSALAFILPDIATCEDCRREIADPQNRRYRYPFTNCTNCGPRFSIIQGLPYDRPLTTMRQFVMCPACQAEYDNPADRRFHAQPNACPVCGPQLELWAPDGTALAVRDEALRQTATALREGQIVALKGLGGFHLLVDACNQDAVKSLRGRKHREAKPLALMLRDLAAVRHECQLSAEEERLLTSPQSPIVLLRRASGESEIAPAVAPGNPYLGVMLPYTPLHHLLLEAVDGPLVATSGNLSDEPICTDEEEARLRLAGIADLFLVHNRPLARHVDDSVVRVVGGRELVLRRARGYAPLPVHLATPAPAVLAVGAHLKNATAVAVDKAVFVSQHIGDLETGPALAAFRRVMHELPALYAVQPVAVACDAHPDYLSTQYAHATGLPVISVQHHAAHVLSCMAENELAPPALGFAWDGSGYGSDGTVWGGETLLVDETTVRRVAHLRPFGLPGGERAVREPRRAALGLLYEAYGEAAFEMTDLSPVASLTDPELGLMPTMLLRGVNTPRTSSMGRLFDGVAALAGLQQVAGFEGQAAMALEFALHGQGEVPPYEFVLTGSAPLVIDWEPVVAAVIADVRAGRPVAEIARAFHDGLAEMIVAVSRRLGADKVALSGGCFQNQYLTERALARLQAAGLRPYWHQRVPPNDGGIALGQIAAAAREMRDA